MTERLDAIELVDLQRKTASNVQLGAVYKHKKSGDYYIATDVCLVIQPDKSLLPSVTYHPATPYAATNTPRFNRGLEDFLAKFEKFKRG